ncbi:carbon-nitrogen hydrolase family protein [Thiopseudomonas acetoxidans]|uniref:Carbon-nitrogen hydrolase family protein n=1 Tax=Thiopseudomonas acetoxidans TaxID=3041622 RepID=A0ABT7SL03_9GAMM|nr:carbon-nitrogen hydrolase family protein [Thiopseudomonas sp. CY1220]MDM7856867.1 carbon-nitrogen hydrolase family protein [Thiopseudomonas sp. CY1220]
MQVAVIQMVSTADIEVNLRQAQALLEQASDAGARLAVLPENFAVFGHANVSAIAQAEAEGGPIIRWLKQTAARLKLWIVAGTLPLADDEHSAKPFAACLVFTDRGEQVARYNKLHLFDAAVTDQHEQYCESATYQAGNEVVLVDTPLGRLGLSVCYDLRFPGLYSQLREQGAELIAVPSAFTAATGAAHWHSLLRARAIETQCYILAANQGGQHTQTRMTYGHSLILDPWGEICAEHAQGQQVIQTEINLPRLHEVRQQMPVWQHRRFSAPQLGDRIDFPKGSKIT